MSSNQFNEAWSGIEAGWSHGQLAHAYLLQGAAHGAALRFAEKLLDLIFNHHAQIRTRTHPDIIWLEPQSKSRQIGIDEIRDLIRQLSRTSFAGGWKAGIILCADRMTDQAANSLLKTLEEPPANTLLILVTDEPQSLLATISSRCQRIALSDIDDEVARHWKDSLLDILSDLPPVNVTSATLCTSRITALLNELKKEFEAQEAERIPDDLSAKESKALLDARSTARLIESRTELLRTMIQWQRDVLMRVLEQDESTIYFQDDLEAINRQALLCTRSEALARIAAIEAMGRQFDRNLPAELVFNNFFAQLV